MPTPDNLLTDYAQELKNQGKYPLHPRTSWKERAYDPEHPVATTFLVIPNFQGDLGIDRPLDLTQANLSQAIKLIDAATGLAVTTPVIDQTCSLQCQVQNFGAVGSFAGIAEFYVASPAILDAFALGGGPRPSPLGYAGLIIPPGGETTAVCQRQWSVTDLNIAILVCIYDPIVDRATFPYDSAADRHVARLNIIPDFTGAYLGNEYLAGNPGLNRSQKKIVIQQANNVAAISIYTAEVIIPPSILNMPQHPGNATPRSSGIDLHSPAQVVDSGQSNSLHQDLPRHDIVMGFPPTPQITGSASITGSTFVFTDIENNSGQPNFNDIFTFTYINPNHLQYTLQRHYIVPGDPWADKFLVADLHRNVEPVNIIDKNAPLIA